MPRWFAFLFVLALSIMSLPIDATAAEQAKPASVAPEPVRYTLSFPSPQTHYVEVQADVPTRGRPQVELEMAVWTPGSYLVREYSRHVEQVRAESAGQPRAVDKLAKNKWRVQTGGAASVTVRYQVYGREMTVRTNFVEAEFALINGAPTFLTLADDPGPRPHEVTLALPVGWKTSMTGLPAAAGSPHRYRAADFDTLVDSPIVAGNPAVYEFSVKGVPHFLVNVGEGGVWDGPRSAADVQKIVEAQAAFWGVVPYDKYVFINMITEASGGLEHKNSTVLMTSRWRTRSRRGYVDWLSLVSHELFHAWNVKRMRPLELGPFNYEQENYTKTLWVAEGLTSYYGDLLAARAGVITADEYFGELSGMIAELQTTPGRLAQPVEEASFDAWIRYYRPDENTPNTTISYYTKGGVIGFLLDLEIRRASGGSRSLDDVMRLAYQRYSGARGFTSADFRAVVSEVAGRDLSAWLHRALDTTEELDYANLDFLGLRFRPDSSTGKTWSGLTLAAPGSTLRNDGGRLIVTQVRRATPAFEAGVNADDEILALGGYRVRPDQWEARLEAFKPGDRVPLLVARRERLITLELVLGVEPQKVWRLEGAGDAPEAKARLAEWLKS
jgi:predicted metalloprotease with PDZ domain